ncbi:hypothetical protein [Hoeflea sp.]|uniref:hypothetical protein n=1 Tax=Hoeflea sp. TaxID=1940281 RepID=UPI0037496A3E
MKYLIIENRGLSIAELAVQSKDSTAQHYINPDESHEAADGYLFTLSSAEGGDLLVRISNTSERLAHHVYRVSTSATKRQRALMPGRRRAVRLNSNDRLVLMPVGSRDD